MADTGEVIYVGYGNDSRVKYPERNDLHDIIRLAHGIVRKVMWNGDSLACAHAIEIKLIAELHTFIDDPHASKNVCNKTSGGEGSRHCAATRRRISETMKTLERTVEHSKNISIGKKGKPSGWKDRNQSLKHVSNRVAAFNANKSHHKSLKGKTMHRLNAQLASEIRARFLSNENVHALAIEYGVSDTTIRNIGKGASYIS